MRVGRGSLHWYDFVFFAFAAVIVYPDEVLDWVGDTFGKAFTWAHVVVLETVAVLGLITFTVWIMPMYPRLPWWMPLLVTGCIALFRAGRLLVERFFGFDN